MNLSTDAHVILTTMFTNGQTLVIGGEGAQSKFTDRAKAAIDELLEKGMITETAVNDVGRMRYAATEASNAIKRMSMKDLKVHGRWPLTEGVLTWKK